MIVLSVGAVKSRPSGQGYKAEWYGRIVVAINQFFPSSKRCSGCGYTLSKLTLTPRFWVCPECGVKHDRDINAAKNIKAAGLAVESVNSESHQAAQIRLCEQGILVL